MPLTDSGCFFLFLKLAQTRLTTRAKRPNIELVNDPVHAALVLEVQQLQAAQQAIRKQLDAAQTARRGRCPVQLSLSSRGHCAWYPFFSLSFSLFLIFIFHFLAALARAELVLKQEIDTKTNSLNLDNMAMQQRQQYKYRTV